MNGKPTCAPRFCTKPGVPNAPRQMQAGEDGTRHKHPRFAKSRHALLQQRDHDRNEKFGNTLDNITNCDSQCRAASLFGDTASTVLRASYMAGMHVHVIKLDTGCPCCSGRSVWKGNSLETVYPEVAADFDVENDGVTLDQVTSAANTPAFS